MLEYDVIYDVIFERHPSIKFFQTLSRSVRDEKVLTHQNQRYKFYKEIHVLLTVQNPINQHDIIHKHPQAKPHTTS